MAAIHKFNKTLAPITYLVSNHLTLADVCSFALLVNHAAKWDERERSLLVNICRWYDLLQHTPSIEKDLDSTWKVDFVRDLPKIEKKKPAEKAKKTGNKKK